MVSNVVSKITSFFTRIATKPSKSSDLYIVDGFKSPEFAVFKTPEFFKYGHSFPGKTPREF